MRKFESRFPDPRTADPSGIVAVGGPLDSKSLIDAYTHGIFPWPHEGYPLLWFSPSERGIIDFTDLHVPKSLAKWIRKIQLRENFRWTQDQAFNEVISACASIPRRSQAGTWITPEMMAAYLELSRGSMARSLEVWRDEKLLGGLYAVEVASYVSAESMFGRESNMSKLVLLKFIEILKSEGRSWLDIQMVTPVTQSLGAKLISREEFLERIV